MIGVAFFSVNDVVIKFLSGGYPLHQVVLIRSVIGMTFLMAVIVPPSGGLPALKTRKLGQHALRAAFVVIANICFFLGLAQMPIADAVAIFFVSPLVITVASVVFLKEPVGPHRWGAIAVGMIGVLVMLRPGTGSFQMAALFPLAAACCYAGLHIMTRRFGGTETAAAMSFYIQLTFIIASGAIGLIAGNGRFDIFEDPSLQFLLRAWVWPDPANLWLLLAIGITSALGGTLISQAYKLGEAPLVAPFEYIAMPFAIFWGVFVFGDWPDAVAWGGIALIIGAGLYLLWRETVQGAQGAAKAPTYRR